VKKFIALLIGIISFSVMLNAQSDDQQLTRKEKSQKRKDKINELIKEEEEGAMIFHKQSIFGFKLNTDGWGLMYEHGRYKTITKTNIWWLDLGEHKNSKQDKTTASSSSGFAVGNPYVFGKENNFYYLKFGVGSQFLIGGKGNKNGVAVSLIYGGGLSLGMLKPYYLQIINPTTNEVQDIKYNNNNDSLFLNQNVILGSSAFGKGFGDIKYVPGFHGRLALRFDYGRYNRVVSAIEAGINFEYYADKMPIMVYNAAHHGTFNGYIAIEFGNRK